MQTWTANKRDIFNVSQAVWSIETPVVPNARELKHTYIFHVHVIYYMNKDLVVSQETETYV